MGVGRCDGEAVQSWVKPEVDPPRLSAAARFVILGGPSSSHSPNLSCEAAFAKSGQGFVRSVAEDAVAALFAGAEIDGAVFFGGVGNWGEVGALVGSVAEGLGFAVTAGAPVVGLACDNSDGCGGFLCDFWSGHSWVGVENLANAIGSIADAEDFDFYIREALFGESEVVGDWFCNIQHTAPNEGSAVIDADFGRAAVFKVGDTDDAGDGQGFVGCNLCPWPEFLTGGCLAGEDEEML